MPSRNCAKSWAPPIRPTPPTVRSVNASPPASSAMPSTARTLRKPRRPSWPTSSRPCICCSATSRRPAGFNGLAMRLLLALLGLAGYLCAQVCVPSSRLQPAGSATAALGESSCRLPDGSLYTEFGLVLPARGSLALDAVALDFAPVAVVRDLAGHAVAS